MQEGACEKSNEQAGAELCQAQGKPEVIVYIGVKVEIVVVIVYG